MIELNPEYTLQRALKQSQTENAALQHANASAQPKPPALVDVDAEPPRLFRAYDASMTLMRGFGIGGASLPRIDINVSVCGVWSWDGVCSSTAVTATALRGRCDRLACGLIGRSIYGIP
jgi:hypothetical protein